MTRKRFMKYLLSFVAVFAMAVALVGLNVGKVSAANNNTITIENAQPGQSYQLYKLFNATTNSERQSGTSESNGIAYDYTLTGTKSLNSTFSYTSSDGNSHEVSGDRWFSIDAAGNVTKKDNTDTTSLTTEDFQNWAKKFGEKIGDAKTVSGTQSNSLVFDRLSDGYYFISSTMGSLVTVTSVAPNAIVRDKNGTPAVTKDEDVKTSSVGDIVTYNITINIPKGATNVVFHDQLGTGLDLQGTATDVSLHIDSVTGNVLDKSNYNIDYYNKTASTENNANGDNITISFKNNYLKSLTEQTTLHFSYSAKINESAVVNMPNKAWVTYGENNTKSTESEVFESAFSFKINKLDSENNNLNGAKFVLSKNDNLGNLTTNNYTDKNSYLLSFNDNGIYTPNGTSKLFTANNSIYFKGLNDNENNDSIITYYLYEVKAPDGYQKLTGPIAIKITPTFDQNVNNGTHVSSYKVEYQNPGDTSWSSAVNDNGNEAVNITDTHNINVVNKKGLVLPSTGGMGTKIFYTVGVLIVAAAVVLLIKRKKASKA